MDYSLLIGVRRERFKVVPNVSTTPGLSSQRSSQDIRQSQSTSLNSRRSMEQPMERTTEVVRSNSLLVTPVDASQYPTTEPRPTSRWRIVSQEGEDLLRRDEFGGIRAELVEGPGTYYIGESFPLPSSLFSLPLFLSHAFSLSFALVDRNHRHSTKVELEQAPRAFLQDLLQVSRWGRLVCDWSHAVLSALLEARRAGHLRGALGSQRRRLRRGNLFAQRRGSSLQLPNLEYIGGLHQWTPSRATGEWTTPNKKPLRDGDNGLV